MFLSDLGAEVVKVEDPTTGGDEARAVPPFNDPGARDGLYYQSLNRGARSITLNLRTPEGRDLLHRLVGRADAVYNNMRGDLPGKLGLDYAALKTANPRVVCCSLSGFGRTGPRAADPRYYYLLQAYAGFMSVTGEPDAPPTKCGVSIVDFSGGILSALALMIGLSRARTAGVGCDLDVSLLDTAISMLNYMAVWTLNRDWRPQRLPEGAHQSLVPSQSFQTRDGWIVIMCMKEKFWERLVERIGLAHLRDDPRFRTFADRLAHRDALRPILGAEFLRHTTAEWLERLRGQVPIAPVYAVEEALADQEAFLRAWQRQLHDGRWVGIHWPREYGGRGASVVEHYIFQEEMAAARAPEIINRIGVNLVGPTLIAHGSEAQKRRFLPQILPADELWCQLFSEPGAGSDLTALRTRAERRGDGWVVTGQKVWTSYAQFARWGILLARTGPAAPGARGISYFICDLQAPGVTVRPLRQMTGSEEFNEVFLEDVFVPHDHLVGGETQGWAIANTTLAHERGTSPRQLVIHRMLLDDLLRVARARDGARDPFVRQRLAQ